MLQHNCHKKNWLKIALALISFCLLTHIGRMNASEKKRRKRPSEITSPVIQKPRARSEICNREQISSDAWYKTIMICTKWRTDALTIEHMKGNIEYGIAHLEFLIALEDPHHVIHCSRSKKILRDFNLLNSAEKIPQDLYRACAWYRAQARAMTVTTNLAHTNTA